MNHHIHKIRWLLVALLWLLPAGLFAQAQHILASNGLGRTLSLISLQTGLVQNNIVEVGQAPNDIIVRGEFAYVVNSLSHDITVVDLRTMQITRTIPLTPGSNPYEMEFIGSNRAYITNLRSNSVSILNVATGQMEGEIAVGQSPEGLLVTGGTALVTNSGFNFDTFNWEAGSVSIIDTKTHEVVQTLDVPLNPSRLIADGSGRIHVVCTGNFGFASPPVRGNIVRLEKTFPAPTFAPVWVVKDTIPIGHDPADIAITAQGLAYVPAGGFETGAGILDVYNANTGAIIHAGSDSLVVGGGASSIIIDDATNRLFMSAFIDDLIQELDPATGQVLRSFEVGDGPGALALFVAPQDSDPWPDRVVRFTPGTNWSGFGNNFFPANVLGPPDQNRFLTETNQSADPAELLSLGTGGEIILQFVDNVIVDEDGADFTVFENPFLNTFADPPAPFAETAIVAVSQDGIHFVTFPWDTVTLAGLAGKTPTRLGDPLNPDSSGGDAFDLADVGLEWAAFVRLTDTGLLFTEGAFAGDFDLDAVVAIHSGPSQISERNQPVARQLAGTDSARATWLFADNHVVNITVFGTGPVNLQVTVTASGDAPPAGNPAVTPLSRGLLYYDITTDATAISAQLEFSYSDSLLASRGLTEAGLVAAFFDESDNTWKSPPGVRDTSLNVIRVTTNHFSVWVIADSTQDIITGVENLAQTPEDYRLSQNWPNPFNPETRIAFTVPAPGPVRIGIYDALGRLVRTLVDGRRAAGEYTERWDGRDRFGRQMATGVYFYRMDAGGFLQTRKMLLLR